MPYKDPAKMAEYMRNRRMKMKNQGVNDKVNVNPVNPQNVNEGKEKNVSVNPVNHVNRKPVNPSVNPTIEKYLLSYSRNKYQYVLYVIDTKGGRSLVRSCKKNDILKLGPCEIQLTWGPDNTEGDSK
jgi:hypothetical protein